MRNMRALQIRGVKAAFGFVKDAGGKNDGIKKSKGKVVRPEAKA